MRQVTSLTPEMVFAFRQSRSLFEAVRHTGFGQSGSPCFHPSVEKGFLVRRWIALGVFRPRRRKNFLALVQLVVVGVLFGGPLAGFLQCLDRTGMHGDHPVLGLPV